MPVKIKSETRLHSGSVISNRCWNLTIEELKCPIFNSSMVYDKIKLFSKDGKFLSLLYNERIEKIQRLVF